MAEKTGKGPDEKEVKLRVYISLKGCYPNEMIRGTPDMDALGLLLRNNFASSTGLEMWLHR